MKFYKRDPDAALAGMAELSLQERGAYNTIIDLLYARDGLLRDDDDALRRIMGCHGNEWRTVKARLIAKGKVWIEDGLIKAKRVESVLKEAGNVSETQRIRAEKRWQIERERPTKNKKNERKQTPKDASAAVPYKDRVIDREESPRGDSSLDEPTFYGVHANGFDENLPKGAPAVDDWPKDHVDLFWHAYPPQRRTEKAKVAKKLEQLRKGKVVTWRRLMEGLERYKRSRDVQRGYAKGPMPWLNGGCWDDEIGAVAAPREQKPESLLSKIATEGLRRGEDHDDHEPEPYDGPTLDLRALPDPRRP